MTVTDVRTPRDAPTRIVAVPRTPLSRLRWAVTDTWVVAQRDLVHWVRSPAQVFSGLLFPGMMVLLFGYVFGSAMTVENGGDYREFLMPGLFALVIIMGVGETVTAVADDAGAGVTDRFRSIPMSRVGVVAGRCLADMMNSVMGLCVLVLCGLVVGWRAGGSLLESLAAVALLLLLRISIVWIGIYLGLLVKTPEAAAAVWTPLFPIAMISNAFVSPEQMPGWLRVVAELNPMSATVTATRELFDNPGTGGTSWLSENALLMAVVWPALVTAIFFPLAVHRYRKMSR
ncbi:ABC transporter permease [Streptomyces iconiensis]|uniref:Transport permease protein n=1 Tax=Streptomyces iconiensis TaxID=1384038 RepID=A0ABT7A6D9_9ACTN|nr:ABC transporter permease [Streptomyces iconiensis]MDJ1136876.1 ABC transporter permease [Streptomyces iconiensis]